MKRVNVRLISLLVLAASLSGALIGCGGSDGDGDGDRDGKKPGGPPAANKDAVAKPPAKPQFSIVGQPGFDTPKKSIDAVVSYLKDNDFDSFWALAVTADDVKTFDATMSLLNAEEDLDVVEKSQLGLYLFKMARANMEHHQRLWRKAFDALHGQLDFSKASMGGITAVIQKRGGVQWCKNASVFITVDDQSYELTIGQLLLTPRGWLILDDEPLQLKAIAIDEAN